jgi:RNA polymerase sigma factor (sigma-70 family)
MPQDDAALLRRWTDRQDAQAFSEIVERFADQVYATCRRILRNDADAEEVAQECFLHLVRSGNDVHSSLGGWLHGVATNKSRERVRSEVNRRAREQAYGEGGPKVWEANWDDIQEHVDAALETLPPDTRDIIVAHFIGRKKQADIAAEWRIGRRAVSHRIQRGLASVRNELRQRGVTVSAAALGASLASDASAAPLSLKASLGKLAIAAGAVPGAGGTTTTSSLLGSLFVMKTKAFVSVLVICLIAAGLYVVTSRETVVKDFPPPEIPVAIVAEESEPVTDSTSENTNTLVTGTEQKPDESPTINDLLALSFANLERAAARYVPIENAEQYASIAGSVLDKDGYPIPGSTVLLTPANLWGKLPGAGEMSHAVSVESNGSYVIKDIRRGGRYWVGATCPGYADAARGAASGSPISIDAGMDVTGVDFILENGATLCGRVLTDSGKPVTDGVVQGISVSGSNSASMMQRYSARCDPEGYFTMGFEEKALGSVTSLRVQSARYGSSSYPDIVIQEGELIVLRLAEPGVLHGTVRYDDGKPVPDARLNIYGSKRVNVPGPGGSEVRERHSFAASFYGVCDAEGRYAVEVDTGLDLEIEVASGGAAKNQKREQLDALNAGERRRFDAVLDSKVITVRGQIIGNPSGKPSMLSCPWLMSMPSAKMGK